MMHNTKQVIDELVNLRNVVTSTRNPEQHTFSKYSGAFAFTTENISGYLDQIEVADRDILVPAASGDHALEALVKGANSVDLFDINAYAYHMARLKFAAVETLTKDEFLRFFLSTDEGGFKNDKMFDINLYKKIREKLPQYSKNFWDQVYSLLRNNGFTIAKSPLVINSSANIDSIVDLLDYLKDDNYDLAKEKLIKMDEKNIEFYNTSVTELPNVANKKYDLILLSNIQDYLEGIYPKCNGSIRLEKYRTFIFEELSKLLNDDGQIVSEYYYYYYIMSYILPKYNQQVIEVPSVFDIIRNKNDDHVDAAFVYKKERN